MSAPYGEWGLKAFMRTLGCRFGFWGETRPARKESIIGERRLFGLLPPSPDNWTGLSPTRRDSSRLCLVGRPVFLKRITQRSSLS